MTIKKTHKNRPAPADHAAITGFRSVLLGAVLACMMPFLPVVAQTAIKPASELARLSLLEGASQSTPPDEVVLWGGLEFRLAPKVKTYWRTVGDSGLPPVFSWTGSRNLRSVEVLWPVPVRFQDQSGSSIGYHDHLVLPLKVLPLDPKQPVQLKLSLDYAVCETLCMPAHFDGALTLSPRSTRNTASHTLIRETLDKVPVAVALNAQAPLSLRAITAQDKVLELETVWPAGTEEGDIFVEGPEGWVFGQPVRRSLATDPAGRRIRRDQVAIEEKPQADSPLSGLELIITLSTQGAGIETRATLDKQGRAP